MYDILLLEVILGFVAIGVALLPDRPKDNVDSNDAAVSA